jgi:hypothetical protein
MARTRTGAVVLVAGLSVVGCGGVHATGAEHKPRSVPISTSSWKPGDSGMQALIRGTLRFTPDGCPVLAPGRAAVVWPAGYSSVVKANGEQVVITTDGREIDAGDTVRFGGGSVPRSMVGKAASRMPCVPGRDDLTYVQSPVNVTRGH